MAYGYYQQSGMPGWGTNQFQFGAPPAPSFQPQPTWGGTDFYRAHASTNDPYLFDHAWNRVREYGGAPAGGIGVGLHEARHWHRRAYAGLSEIGVMQPHEIGHAAAYEAYRTLIHNSHIYEPLSGDIERQREALTGLAVAEASRLLQFSSRPMDNYARLAASEAAAHTASYIFYQSRDGEYRSRSQYRQSCDDPYALDNDLFSGFSGSRSHRHRSHSRRPRSFSQSSGGIPTGIPYSSSSSAFSEQPYGRPVPTPYSHGAALPQGSSYSLPQGSSYSIPPYSAPASRHGSTLGVDYPASHQGSTLGVDYPPRSRSSSFSHPQQDYHQQDYREYRHPAYSQGYPQSYSQPPYLQSAYSAYSQSAFPQSALSYGSYMGSASSMVPVAPGNVGTTVIIHKKKRSKSKRSKSTDPNYYPSSFY